MKKFLLPVTLLTSLFLLAACAADNHTNQPTENESVITTENTLQDESTSQETVTDEAEAVTNETEAATENQSYDADATAKEHTSEKTTNENVNTTQASISENTTAKTPEKETKPTVNTETTTLESVEIITKEEATTVQSTSENLITKAKAKQIALNHAGLAEANISKYEIETDREKNSVTYEISFHSGNFEYEYEINAANGKIIKSEKEAEKSVKPQTTPETTTVQNTSENLITKANAKQIALNHAGLAEANISRYEIETDREKNSVTYEISFNSGNFEYEYEINAENGKIIKSEKEAEKNVKPQTAPETTTVQNTSENLITKANAKQIALNHAGLAEANISRYEIETDREKNSVTYEISFHSGNFEYEYEINAANGKIIKSEKEHID